MLRRTADHGMLRSISSVTFTVQDVIDRLGVMDASRFRRHIQVFHVRLTKASRSFRVGDINLERQRNSALAEYGFTKNRSTVFLDAVLRRQPGNICAIMGYIGREHMHLPMVLDAYYRYASNAIGSLPNLTDKPIRFLYRDLDPTQIHYSRKQCEPQRSENRYRLVGAMIMDRRASTGILDYLILIRLYDQFFKCPFT